MSIYDRIYECPGAECGAEITVPYRTPQYATCPECGRVYEVEEDGNADDYGRLYDCTRLIPKEG